MLICSCDATRVAKSVPNRKLWREEFTGSGYGSRAWCGAVGSSQPILPSALR
jgi:hypothetical protein